MAIVFPLAPVIASLFMAHHGSIWLEEYNQSSVLFYRRYVDDTFCVFETEHDALVFFYFINSRHANIRFTMEKKFDNKFLSLTS